jgi:hypothetical protein
VRALSWLKSTRPTTVLSALKDVAFAQTILFLCAAGLVWRARLSGPAIAVILLVGAVCRAPLALAPPLFSDDVYRDSGRSQGKAA